MLLHSLVNPKTFSEKIQRLKILNRDPRLPQRENKILVKDFVRQRLGSDWVTPTLWQGEFLPPLERRNWPLPFVIKANNGCGWNVFIRHESDLDWTHIESTAAKWRHTSFGADIGEWLYSEIKPALLVEPFIGESANLPLDYKLWTFGGKVRVVQVDTDREHDHKRAMFDLDWQRLPFALEYPNDPRPIAKPVSLDRMIQAAAILAEDFSFVRIDFYEIGGQPKFGEMSFYPGSGFEVFNPPEWDAKIGKFWQ
jgi:TupA-like ATPgrasp